MNHSEQQVLDEMNRQNPWWKSDKIELEPGLIERDIFPDLMEETHRITALIGLRRTGKTTLLYQIISRLLEEHPSENILYYSFDAVEKEEMIVRRIISHYFQNILKEVPEDLERKTFIFFDEIQKIERWGEEIKSIWDRKYPIKFFISGSSSMNIMKGSGESLVGRIGIHKIYPFSYREFLKYNKVEFTGLDMMDLVDQNYEYPLNSEKLQVMFKQYMEEGGFPEMYREQHKKKYISDTLSLTFYRDIINLLPVKRPEVLEGLFHQFINQSGQKINYNKLSNSLDTRYETIKNYIEYLEMSFLIDKSYSYTENRLKRYRKNPKIYVSDHGFSHLEYIKTGLMVETMVYNHLNRRYEIFYGTNGHETDIILLSEGKLISIEVKYKENIEKSDIEGLLGFMDEHSLEKGIIVTKKDLKEETIGKKTILFVPAWLFLLSM